MGRRVRGERLRRGLGEGEGGRERLEGLKELTDGKGLERN